MTSKRLINCRHVWALAAVGAMPGTLSVFAQDFPARPVPVIVGQPAGGGMDTLAS